MLPMNLAALAFNRPLDHGKLSSTTRPTSASSIPAMSMLPTPAVGVFDLQIHHGSGSRINRGGKEISGMAENAGGFRVPDLAL